MKTLRQAFSFFGLALLLTTSSAFSAGKSAPKPTLDCEMLEKIAEPGDLVFLHIDTFLFKKLADLQDSWATHVGIVVEDFHGKKVVAESHIPKSSMGPICDYVKRSANYRVAIRRPLKTLSPGERFLLTYESERRMGIWYDLGFDYDDTDSQYCSKFVYQVMESAANRPSGKLQTFEELKNEAASAGKDIGDLLKFWSKWFGGEIPWKRVTVTPASQYKDPSYRTVYEKL